MNKKKLIPIIVVILILIIAILYFEVFRKMDGSSDKIEGSGTIEVTEVEISSKIAGRVLELPKQEGSDVNKGDLIVKLDYEELNAQKLSVQANYINAEKNLKRISELYKSGSVSKQSYDNAETAYRMAKAGYGQISATIENAIINSPINGTVLDTNLEVGEMAFPGTAIITVADLSEPWMYVYVNEMKVGYVKLGQKAFVSVDSFPGKKFNAKVVAISNKAEFTPKTIQTKEERVKLVFAVKIAVENPDMSLKPGMPADAEIITN